MVLVDWLRPAAGWSLDGRNPLGWGCVLFMELLLSFIVVT